MPTVQLVGLSREITQEHGAADILIFQGVKTKKLLYPFT